MPPVVVVSDRFWRTHLGADPHAVGRGLRLNGSIATIVGIGPKDFLGIWPQSPADLFVPARLWHGTPRERNRFEIFGDGTYIHWPALDEDLTVAGLLAGRQSGESPQSLKKWMDSRKRNKPVPPRPRKPVRG